MVFICEVRVGFCVSVNNDRIYLVKINYYLISLVGYNIINFNKFKILI